MEMAIDSLNFSYADKQVLHGITFCLEKPQMVVILGPNGVGKSTLIYCIDRLLNPQYGTVLLDGQDIDEMPLKELALKVAYVPCASSAVFQMSVIDSIMIGRQPRSAWRMNDSDMSVVHDVIEMLDIEDLMFRPISELSAGQRQKVMIARGLVQETQVLLLDEPTANLDVKHQMEVMDLMKFLVEEKEKVVLAVCHDINLAAKYADSVLLMSDGGIFASGSPAEVITAANIEKVYGVQAEVIVDEGRPHVIFKYGTSGRSSLRSSNRSSCA